MLSTITTGAVHGIQGYAVRVEAQMGFGAIYWNMVGLPEGAVREARVRIKSAMEEGGFEWPMRPISINLAPANVRKDGTAFDLPIALSLLAAERHIPCTDGGLTLPGWMVLGELGLGGEVRPIRGVLPLCIAARDAGMRGVMVPEGNGGEAALVDGLEIVSVGHLRDVVAHARGERLIAPLGREHCGEERREGGLDLRDIKGQHHARRALEVAAAGGHNLLMVGPPGSGKTMLARRLPSILPPLEREEALMVTSLFSVAGLLPKSGWVGERPFRAPHHTISDVGLVGGGPHLPRPGEASLASHGVLFLDELPEFRRQALEALRQPLEDQSITITRSLSSIEYPARVMLVGAMNGCPCGYVGSRRRACVCRPEQVQRYVGRLSGPLLDRIDIHLELADLTYEEMSQRGEGEGSEAVRGRVVEARKRQRERFGGAGSNARMGSAQLLKFCEIGGGCSRLMERAVERLGLSARAHDRIVRLSRTIADLAGSRGIEEEHVAEAIGYRCLDRR